MKITNILTNPDTDYLLGRNGSAKLTAIQVWDAHGTVYIDGINSKGAAVSNSGFRFAATTSVLRELSEAFAQLAEEKSNRNGDAAVGDTENHTEVIRKAIAAMYRNEADAEKTIKAITSLVSKENLADFIVDVFNRGWITKFNLGIDDDGNVI